MQVQRPIWRKRCLTALASCRFILTAKDKELTCPRPAPVSLPFFVASVTIGLGCPKMLQNNQFLSPKKWPYLPEQENVVLRFMISRIVTGTSS
ncbi:MAG: hypothetical protein IPH35_07245 [Rhodoferax sp.]|nr:hypothetical protein [Rhodoferax sp.]